MRAIWICPALCGCEIEVNAAWLDGAVKDEGGRNVSHQHPIPGTIIALDIVNVCPVHLSVLSQPIPADPYSGSPGYMRIPDNPTDADKLYIYLFRYTGQIVHPATCKCKMYEHGLRTDSVRSIKSHPRHTVKCQHHLSDDDQHTSVRGEVNRLNRMLQRAEELFPVEMPRNGIEWYYDDARVLHVKAPELNQSRRTQLQAAADTLFGAGRVIIEQ